MSRRSWRCARVDGGFTLIEVIGALLIFSVGVLMVIQLSDALGVQMRYAGIRSELSVLAQERLDSIEATPLGSLVTGTTAGSLVVMGESYVDTLVVELRTPVLARVRVKSAPADGSGPSLDVESFVSEAW